MAHVEIRCPRCGSMSHLRNREKHEYLCSHCKATFVFLDTTKSQVIQDTKRHNCPICGQPVKMDEGYLCTKCRRKTYARIALPKIMKANGYALIV
jgi:DNA-directed RNA polymerase subunit RPC12/RpoP